MTLQGLVLIDGGNRLSAMKKILLNLTIIVAFLALGAVAPAFSQTSDYVFCRSVDSRAKIVYFSDVFPKPADFHYPRRFTDYVRRKYSPSLGYAMCFTTKTNNEMRARESMNEDKDYIRPNFVKFIDTGWSDDE